MKAKILIIGTSNDNVDLINTLNKNEYDIKNVVSSGEEALEIIKTNKPDLIVIDIKLSGKLDGIQTAEKILELYKIPLIYLTNFTDELTIYRAKKTAPAAYLVRPIKASDLIVAIEIALYNSKIQESKQENSNDLVFNFKDRFFVKEKDTMVRVDINDVLWIKADRTYYEIKTKRKSFLQVGNLSIFSKKISHPLLVRVNRSYIVNIDKITSIKGNMLIIEGNEILIGETYREHLEKSLFGANKPEFATQLSPKNNPEVNDDPNNTIDELKNTRDASPNLQSSSRPSLAELLSDSDKGEDYLNIENDVRAFAKIVAARGFRPPLAIALFGKWGTGKSFFMNKMQEKISEYVNTKNHNAYCKGIVQIRFNAWSYLDANLWASIITRIFEGLNEYIQQNSKSDLFKQEIEKELAEKLTITSEEINFLEKQKKATEDQLQKLEEEKNSIQETITNKINQIENRSLKNIITAIDKKFRKENLVNSLKENSTNGKLIHQLELEISENYWHSPIEAYNQVSSTYIFLKRFFSRDKLVNNILFLAICALVIIGVPFILQQVLSQFKNQTFLLPQVCLAIVAIFGTVFQRFSKIKDELQPIISALWKVKEEYESDIKDAIFRYEQQDKAIRLQIENSKSEVAAINRLIHQAKATVIDLDFKINNALATEALYSFIDRRSNSEDYNKHLGIVSIIRKDFEILSDLFDQYQKENAFQNKLRKPLERIVLYIDDLDRCPEERVVEVLESINLLMAYKLFIVVVGVDQRWVKNALLKRHQLQFSHIISDNSTIHGIEIIEASNYLEKIIQVPFHLKEATDISVKNMIRKLALPSDSTDEEPNHFFKTDEETENENSKISFIGEGSPIETFYNTVQDNNEANLDKPESLKLSDHEIRLLQDFSCIIGSNPRAVKRYLNTYRIVRVHDELNLDLKTKDNEFLVLMFLLALSIGPFKEINLDFREFIFNNQNRNKTLSHFLQSTNKKVTSTTEDLKKQLDIILTDKASYSILQKEPIASFEKNYTFIQRFSF